MKGKIKELLGARKENKDVKLPIFSDQKIRKIIDEIYEPQFGARPLERYIENAIEPTLIKQLMKKNK
ncbi:hypothetical protein KKH82_04810 [Patescibacteria group bacterium]|nr:hypothetical protein [Patescibacteria group bacterium]